MLCWKGSCVVGDDDAARDAGNSCSHATRRGSPNRKGEGCATLGRLGKVATSRSSLFGCVWVMGLSNDGFL